jgi:2-hydroxychromene-2-carboxylate isomerase
MTVPPAIPAVSPAIPAVPPTIMAVLASITAVPPAITAVPPAITTVPPAITAVQALEHRLAILDHGRAARDHGRAAHDHGLTTRNRRLAARDIAKRAMVPMSVDLPLLLPGDASTAPPGTYASTDPSSPPRSPPLDASPQGRHAAGMTNPAPVRFLFDFLSPYAYLGWTQIHALAERNGRAVEPVPVLLAVLLNANGQKGPAEIPNKRVFVFKQVLRHAHRLGLPLVPPPTHPFNPLLALRAASLPMEGAARRALIDELFRATWGGGGGVEGPAEVAAAATAAGLDGAALVRAAGEAGAKERLKAQTAEALAAGAFGVPTVIVGEELFWGFDSFGDVETHLRGEDPVKKEMLGRWAGLKASASRI